MTFLDDVLARWGLGKDGAGEARGPRWYRRHGQREDPNTANKTQPKSGARRRRFLEMRLRARRRTAREARAHMVSERQTVV